MGITAPTRCRYAVCGHAMVGNLTLKPIDLFEAISGRTVRTLTLAVDGLTVR